MADTVNKQNVSYKYKKIYGSKIEPYRYQKLENNAHLVLYSIISSPKYSRNRTPYLKI